MAETSSSALRPRARSAILLCVLLGLEALTAQSTFRSTGSMNAARVYFSLTPLSNAGVLAAGGYSSDGAASATAEVFDLASESWALTGPMAQPRGFHAAVLLKNNKVLVAGGSASGSSLSSAELYDAGLGRWSPASPMFTARSGHGAYALDDGRVLVAGGGVDAAGTATAEVYNPPTNRWTPTGSMIFPRAFFSGVVLPDGRVLVAGGLGSPATSETYNPWTETWSLAGALNFPHGTGSSLTLLSNGQALILGGGGQAELFDPVTGVWTPTTPMPATRSGHSATLLGTGLVFVTGHDPRREPGASLVYDPLPQTWRWMAGSAPMFNLA